MRGWMVVMMLAVSSSVGNAQSHQHLDVIDSGRLIGTVEIGRGHFVFTEAGVRYLYSRDSRYDSVDGNYVGYFNTTLNRAVRFPRSGRGQMLQADFDDAFPRFTFAAGTLRPHQNHATVGVGPNSRPGAGSRPGSGTRFGPGGPVGHGYDPYRIGFGPIVPSAGYRSSYSGNFYNPLVTEDPYLRRRPFRSGPQSVLLESYVVPNDPLPQVRARLINTAPREIQVSLVNLSNSQATTMRIAPGASSDVLLQRDSGARRVSVYRVITPLGEAITQEVVAPVPPSVLYEIVVHQWQVQSVAIDRTGKSPQTIEDINMQGRGLGRFPVPPNFAGGNIDVVREAKAQQNQGSVAPLVPEKESREDSLSPTERAILEAQRAAQRGIRGN